MEGEDGKLFFGRQDIFFFFKLDFQAGLQGRITVKEKIWWILMIILLGNNLNFIHLLFLGDRFALSGNVLICNN